jgi:hypothetical protein
MFNFPSVLSICFRDDAIHGHLRSLFLTAMLDALWKAICSALEPCTPFVRGKPKTISYIYEFDFLSTRESEVELI